MSDRGHLPARLRGLPGIAVDRVGAAADEAARARPDLLRLENLDTDLRPPAAALAATAAAIARDDANSYLPFLGQHALREAVAAHVGRRAGTTYDPRAEVIVTAGGLNGVLVALLALIDAGDQVLLTDPTYIGLVNRVRVAGGVPVLAPFEWDGAAWRLDRAALARAVGPRTRAMLLMSPSMPSGALLDAADWEAIAALCRDADLWLLYDAAMERIVFDGRANPHPAALPGMRERTITIGSASKELRMIGWRVGWVVGPPEAMNRIGLVSISDCVVPVGIGQPGVAAALTDPGAGADLAAAVAVWQERRDVMLAELAGLAVRAPAGGWSLLVDVGPLGLTGEQASERLLRDADVAATPMTGWGERHGAQYIRLVYSNEPAARLRGLGERVRRALIPAW